MFATIYDEISGEETEIRLPKRITPSRKALDEITTSLVKKLHDDIEKFLKNTGYAYKSHSIADGVLTILSRDCRGHEGETVINLS